MTRTSPRYHNVDERNAAILAASLGGINPFDIAREHRISTMAVDSVLAAARRRERDRVRGEILNRQSGGQQGTRPTFRDVGKPIDHRAQDQTAISAARRGCRDLLRAEMLYHWNHRTLPPAFTERRFYEVLQNLGLHLSYKPDVGAR
jgi:hypothetical protein